MTAKKYIVAARAPCALSESEAALRVCAFRALWVRLFARCSKSIEHAFSRAEKKARLEILEALQSSDTGKVDAIRKQLSSAARAKTLALDEVGLAVQAAGRGSGNAQMVQMVEGARVRVREVAGGLVTSPDIATGLSALTKVGMELAENARRIRSASGIGPAPTLCLACGRPL